MLISLNFCCIDGNDNRILVLRLLNISPPWQGRGCSSDIPGYRSIFEAPLAHPTWSLWSGRSHYHLLLLLGYLRPANVRCASPLVHALYQCLCRLSMLMFWCKIRCLNLILVHILGWTVTAHKVIMELLNRMVMLLRLLSEHERWLTGMIIWH
jgi:hypothetical protein